MTKILNFNLAEQTPVKRNLKYNQNTRINPYVSTTMTAVIIRGKYGDIAGMARCQTPEQFDYDSMYALANKDYERAALRIL